MDPSASVATPQVVDHLDEDPQIRGQNFACVSFLSPEDVLDNKEIFYFHKFTADLATQLDFLFQNLTIKYPADADLLAGIRENYGHFLKNDDLQSQYQFFKSKNEADIEDEFYRMNNFRTTIRGFKVRGVFDTQQEAEIRAQVLKRKGDIHNIYVAQVGCWVPWAPRPDLIADQRFPDQQLNELMGEYNKNSQKRDEMFEARKNDKLKGAALDKDAWLQRRQEELGPSSSHAANDVAISIDADESVVVNKDGSMIIDATEGTEGEVTKVIEVTDAIAATTI